jgi:hypothetical protein
MNHSQQMTPDQSAMFQEQQRRIEELIKAFNIADLAHQGNVHTRMLVFYEPVQFHCTTWAVLLLKPL